MNILQLILSTLILMDFWLFSVFGDRWLCCHDHFCTLPLLNRCMHLSWLAWDSFSLFAWGLSEPFRSEHFFQFREIFWNYFFEKFFLFFPPYLFFLSGMLWISCIDLLMLLTFLSYFLFGLFSGRTSQLYLLILLWFFYLIFLMSKRLKFSPRFLK